MERIETYVYTTERNWHEIERTHLAPEDHAIIAERAPDSLGLPEHSLIESIARLTDNRVICYATWGGITQHTSGYWVSQTGDEARTLEEFAQQINDGRAKLQSRNDRAIAFMSRPE